MTWDRLHAIGYEDMRENSTDLNVGEVLDLVGNTPEDFRERHLEDTEARTPLINGRPYHDPVLAITLDRETEQPVGYTLGAYYVPDGPAPVRALKHVAGKQHYNLREMAVDPRYPRDRVVADMVGGLLGHVFLVTDEEMRRGRRGLLAPDRPVTMYAWPREDTVGHQTAVSMGMVHSKRERVRPLGPNGREVSQVYMVAPSVTVVAGLMAELRRQGASGS